MLHVVSMVLIKDWFINLEMGYYLFVVDLPTNFTKELKKSFDFDNCLASFPNLNPNA